MRKSSLFAAVATIASLSAVRGFSDEGPFRFGATLRVDLHHVGDHRRDRFLVDELRAEGAWPSSRTQLLDDANFGSTRAEVYSLGRRPRLLYSYGYCSLFGEWRTTDEAKKRARVFSETVRLPMPSSAVCLVMKNRNRHGRWVKVFDTQLDPDAVEVSRERRHGGLTVRRLHGKGAPARSLDIVVLGDGYQAWQMDKFRQDAARFAGVLVDTPPFSRYRDRINVWAVESPSRESGVDEPRKGIFRDTALSMTFNTFGSARYLMTTDNKAVRDVAANAPCDAVYIMSNTSRYGGGGIYNLYASFVSDNAYDEYVYVHEFGHSFAGLADEYYTSKVAYNNMYPRGVEPWEPNITAEKTRARVKWRDQIEAATPVPCAESDRRCAGKVTLFEGAGYSAKGLYRSFLDCKMFNKGHKPFCPVCMRAVSRMIERYLK
jgi:hypothetical protein